MRQYGGEGSLVYVFLVTHRREVFRYCLGVVQIPWWPCLLCVGNIYSVESAEIMRYCISWVICEWFVFAMVMKVCMDFGELVLGV